MAKFNTLDDLPDDLTGKRVLVRVDLNVPMEAGKVTDATRIERVLPTIRAIAEKGGKVILGGKPHALGGTFYEPTIITGATTAMQFAREETFGPVAPLFRFRTEAEAIRLANDTIYGLAG